MPKIYPEALLYCILWTALALAGFHFLGLWAGLALSVGLFLVVMPSSVLILARTGNFALERGVRWVLLVVAGLVVASMIDVGS